jgi:hypothetical protein
VAVASLADPDWVGLHELGHGAFGLADEYCYEAGSYTGSEPLEPNVTAVNTLTGLKWASLVVPTTPIPTTTNPDLTCLTCDTQPSPVAVGTVGLFEGAEYVACGCYRPEYNCLMRTFYVPGARGAPAMRLLVAGYLWVSPFLARITRSRPRLARLLRARVFAPWARLLRRGEGTVP